MISFSGWKKFLREVEGVSLLQFDVGTRGGHLRGPCPVSLVWKGVNHCTVPRMRAYLRITFEKEEGENGQTLLNTGTKQHLVGGVQELEKQNKVLL